MTDDLIEVEALEKVFEVRRRGEGSRWRREKREVRAVDGISFRVPAGEVVGYIGPNGAGKSTTIKMLTGILTPTGGRLRVATGAPSLAWKTGARLLPVFVRRDPASGAFQVLIDDPLPTEPTRSKGEAQQAAVAQYLRRLEAHAVAVPGQWRDWAKLRPAAASPP